MCEAFFLVTGDIVMNKEGSLWSPENVHGKWEDTYIQIIYFHMMASMKNLKQIKELESDGEEQEESHF